MISADMGVPAVVVWGFAARKSRALMTFKPGMRLASFSIARFWICRTRSLLTPSFRPIATSDKVFRMARTCCSRGLRITRSAGIGSGCNVTGAALGLGLMEKIICQGI